MKLPRAVRGILPEDAPIFSMVMLAACAGLFVITLKATSDLSGGDSVGLSPSNPILVRYGATFGPFIARGQWWRLITAMFLHGSILHIVMNSIGLWAAGQVVEDRFGRGQFLVIYLVTGVCGYLASYWQRGQMEFSVGASGAIFGLIGFVVGHVVRERGRARDLRERFVPWLLYGIIFSFTPNVNWMAHFGGLAAGFLLGLVVADKRTARRIVPTWAWAVAGAAAVALMVVAFVLDAQSAPID